MDRLEKGHFGPHARRGEHAQRTADDAGLVGEDVAEHVFGDDDIEISRLADDLHGSVVHEHIVHRHLGILPGYPLGRFTPQTRGFQHVGLVDDCQFAAARHGQPKRHVQDPFDLRDRVGAGVEGARALLVAALRTAEVDAAREFAHADEIRAADHLRLERRTVGQGVEQRHRTQVGEQPQRLAHPQQPLLGPHLRRGVVVVFGVPDGSEQHGVRRKTDGVRLVGIGVAHSVDGRGAHQCGTVFDLVSEFFRHAVQHFRGFGDDLGTDAVAG